jgi:hypothetical protein
MQGKEQVLEMDTLSHKADEKDVEYLPVGTVVIMRGGVKKTMVIARAVALPLDGEMRYFDYGGCMYPEGLVSEDMLYFNHKDIQKIIHMGYEDEDEDLMAGNLNAWRRESGYKQGDPIEYNRRRQAEKRLAQGRGGMQ